MKSLSVSDRMSKIKFFIRQLKSELRHFANSFGTFTLVMMTRVSFFLFHVLSPFWGSIVALLVELISERVGILFYLSSPHNIVCHSLTREIEFLGQQNGAFQFFTTWCVVILAPQWVAGNFCSLIRGFIRPVVQ